jgi:capsular polysaccharide biosynthesis protein
MEKAPLPTSPVGPDKKKNLIIFIVLGLILGVGYSFSWEYLDRSFKTEEDAQRYLKVPVLGIIPKATKRKP